MRLAKLIIFTAALCVLVRWNSGRAADDTPKPTTVILVRHAEKVGESRDAPLSDKGRQRARTLGWMLRDVSFDTIYSTDFARTRDTVAAIARSNGKEISLYSPSPGSLKKKLEREHSGQTVLISGHSNTIPSLLAELGTPINEEILPGYDSLFFLTLDPEHGATMLRLHYPHTR